LIVRDLASGPRRFVELQRVLPGISTEQLRSRLNRMVADGMLTRQRYREVPPRVEYELTERARDLMPVLGELAKWGYDWAWSAPRTDERVDLGAIFRLAPGLLRGPTTDSGTIELTVEDAADGEPVSWTLTVADGRAEITEHPADGADARVSGTAENWIRAFSPGGDLHALRINGEQQLATRLLEGLILSAESALQAKDSQVA
jgi:DNA-binding HxlR family transcriptional regulator